MASTEDVHSRLITHFTWNASPKIKYIEPCSKVPQPSSQRITIVSDPMLPISPLKRSDQSINECDHSQIPASRRPSARPLSMAAIGRQLSVRKTLHNRL
jgi:hypothetical protein